MATISRRVVLRNTGLVAGATILGLRQSSARADQESRKRKLKIIVVGAHPDDPETGCGGTMARYSGEGHDVAALYFTRGEAGVSGKTHDEAARIRTGELEAACQILGARALFAGQIDGSAEVNNTRYDEFRKILETEKPDVVFTQWPIDSHRDHRATSLLTYDAWVKMGKRFALYYYEVYSGIQTQMFHPTDYVDITATEGRKRAATMAHASQNPEHMYKLHDLMNQFRGKEFGCKYAEAFAQHAQGPSIDEML